MSSLSLRRRLALPLLAALMIAGGLARPAAAAADEKPAAVESLLAADTVAFAHFRVADLWKHPSLALARQLLSRAGAEELQAFEARFVPPPSAVESLTVVFPTTDARLTLPFGDPNMMTVLWIATTREPYDRLDVLKALRGERTKKYRSTEYFFDEETWSGLLLLDDRTLVYGSEDAIVAVIDRRGEGGSGELARLFRAEAGKHPAVVGVNPAAFLRPEMLAETPEALQPLYRAKHWLVTLDLDPEAKVSGSMRFANKDRARTGAKAARAALAMARANVGKGIAEMKKQLDAVPKKVPGGLQELPEAIGPLFGLALLRHADSLLKELPVETRGATVAAAVNLDKAVPGGGNATTAMTVVGMFGWGTLRFGSSKYYGGGGPDYTAEDNLRRIAAALDRYQRDKGTYPPPYTTDRAGNPLLSWRVALLPYLDNANDFRGGRDATSGKDLLAQFKLDEPWDSLHNKKLLAKMPAVYRGRIFYYGSRRQGDKKTGMLALVGKGLIFEAGPKGGSFPHAMRKSDIRDGADKTILVVCSDAPASQVFWSKPADLPYASRGALPPLMSEFSNGFSAAFADGSVWYVRKTLGEKKIRALITPNGGEEVDLKQVDQRYRPREFKKPFEKNDFFKKKDFEEKKKEGARRGTGRTTPVANAATREGPTVQSKPAARPIILELATTK